MYNNSSNMTTKNKNGYLEIIIGPMFASKTTRLLEIYSQCEFCNIPVVVINHSSDKRYDDVMLSTHDKRMIPCIQSDNIMDIINHKQQNSIRMIEKIKTEFSDKNVEIDIDIINKKQSDFMKEHMLYKNADVVLINEGQFFPDLYDAVEIMLNDKKHIYICGLDGDFQRKKFGQILDLIPLCDKVMKLTSLCSICKDGTSAIFSMRLTNEKVQTLIGSDNYIPVCRKCYETNCD